MPVTSAMRSPPPREYCSGDDDHDRGGDESKDEHAISVIAFLTGTRSSVESTRRIRSVPSVMARQLGDS